MTSFIRTSNALLILVLMGVICTAFYKEYTGEGPPCPLCLLQRLGMIGMATGILMNLRFGIHIRYYSFSLMSAFIGGAIAIRQICLHICPGFPVFGVPVFGLNLYSWSFIVFCCASISIIIFLFLYSADQKKMIPMNGLEKMAFIALVAVTLANSTTVFQQCGFGPCKDVPWPQPTEQTK